MNRVIKQRVTIQLFRACPRYLLIPFFCMMSGYLYVTSRVIYLLLKRESSDKFLAKSWLKTNEYSINE